MAKTQKWIWLVVLAAATMQLIVAGTRHAFGIFLPPISNELGWGREIFSLGFAIQMFLLGFLGPVAGLVADRFGAGRVLTLGAVLAAAGLYGMSEALTPVGFILSAGVLMGFGSSAVSNVILIGAVGKLVGEAKMGQAVGFLMAGASMGQILMLPIGQLLINNYGWSRALVVLAAMMLLVLPLILVIVRGGHTAEPHKSEQRISHALKEAGGHSGYLLLTIGFFVCGFHVFFLAAHLPAYAQDLGLSPMVGANSLMLIGLFNMLGSNVWGGLGDRYAKKRMLGLIYLLRSMVIAIFLSAPASDLSVYIFSAAIGFLWLGTVPLTSGLVRQIFGTKYLSMLYGIVFASHQVGGFLGAWMAGWLFDSTGSYAIMWGISIGLGLLAAVIHLPIKDQPVGERALAAQPG